MTTPTSFGKFGMTLAFAERTLSEVLRRHLAERDILPETWYALKLLATRGPSMSREALSADLAGSRVPPCTWLAGGSHRACGHLAE